MREFWPGIDKSRILRAVNSVLPSNKAVREVGLVFVSAAEMAKLNKKYRRRRGPTNVLSFAASGEPRFRRDTGLSSQLGSGDVALCPSVIKAEAKKYGLPEADWMTRLIVHGILHLAGYDHKTRKSVLEMERLEDKILKDCGSGLKIQNSKIKTQKFKSKVKS